MGFGAWAWVQVRRGLSTGGVRGLGGGDEEHEDATHITPGLCAHPLS